MNADRSTDEPTGLSWYKSSYSGPEGGECVEVATASATVHVRDSKDRQGPVLRFSPAEWSAFVSYAAARDGVEG